MTRHKLHESGVKRDENINYGYFLTDYSGFRALFSEKSSNLLQKYLPVQKKAVPLQRFYGDSLAQ